MSFYKSISHCYREIFPLQPAQAHFVRESFPEPAKLSLLDVGCGTGDLSLELSSSFGRITGIDLDHAMLKIARESAPENIEFLVLNMLDIKKQLGEGAHDGILCFGNTLVHLNDPNSITDFIQQAKSVLKENGKLLIQIISYDHILDHYIEALPTLDSEHCTFERNYHYDPGNHLVNFETILTIKSSGESIRNQIPLYPLRKAELHSMLSGAGFTSISFYGNFTRDPLEENSIPLIVEATA